MVEIIQWLIIIEGLAINIYSRVAQSLGKTNSELGSFLTGMAEDESWHLHTMKSALQAVAGIDLKADIIVDDITKSAVESPFIKIENSLADGSIDEAELLNAIIDAEFSEWNDIFLYVVNTLSHSLIEFQYISSVIQHHERRMMLFFSSSPAYEEYHHRIERLPTIWVDRILVVDDMPEMRHILSSILSGDYAVDTAEDGVDGMGKISSNYYDLIISDVEMPNMNGIDLFNRLRDADPGITDRFMFMTGNPANADFFNSVDAAFILKPFKLNELHEFVESRLKHSITGERRTR